LLQCEQRALGVLPGAEQVMVKQQSFTLLDSAPRSLWRVSKGCSQAVNERYKRTKDGFSMRRAARRVVDYVPIARIEGSINWSRALVQLADAVFDSLDSRLVQVFVALEALHGTVVVRSNLEQRRLWSVKIGLVDETVAQ